MTPEQASDALRSTSDAIRAAGEEATAEPLLKMASQVAQEVRALAAQSGHSIGIRVASKDRGIRLTVTGRQAGRYRQLVERRIDTLMPEVKTEIRAMVTRRVK